MFSISSPLLSRMNNCFFYKETWRGCCSSGGIYPKEFIKQIIKLKHTEAVIINDMSTYRYTVDLLVDSMAYQFLECLLSFLSFWSRSFRISNNSDTSREWATESTRRSTVHVDILLMIATSVCFSIIIFLLTLLGKHLRTHDTIGPLKKTTFLIAQERNKDLNTTNLTASSNKTGIYAGCWRKDMAASSRSSQQGQQ